MCVSQPRPEAFGAGPSPLSCCGSHLLTSSQVLGALLFLVVVLKP